MFNASRGGALGQRLVSIVTDTYFTSDRQKIISDVHFSKLSKNAFFEILELSIQKWSKFDAFRSFRMIRSSRPFSTLKELKENVENNNATSETSKRRTSVDRRGFE